MWMRRSRFPSFTFTHTCWSTSDSAIASSRHTCYYPVLICRRRIRLLRHCIRPKFAVAIQAANHAADEASESVSFFSPLVEHLLNLFSAMRQDPAARHAQGCRWIALMGSTSAFEMSMEHYSSSVLPSPGRFHLGQW
jgi:hypothetical protein